MTIKTVLLSISLAAAGSVFASAVTPVYTDDGKTATLTVATGQTADLETVFGSTVTKIVKDGGGILNLSIDQSASLAAQWQILEGSVVGDTKAHFGTSASVYVGPQGTLDSIVTSTPRIGVTVAGTVDTSRTTGGISGKFHPINLEGSAATINYGNGYWGVYQTGLYMSGCPLTIKGGRPSTACNVGFRLGNDSTVDAGGISYVFDPGDIIVDGSSLCLINGDIVFSNTEGHSEKPQDAKVVLKNGGYLNLSSRDPAHAFPMGIRVGEGTGTLVAWSGWQNVGYNQVSGPVEVGAGNTLDVWARSGTHATLSGSMSGTGALSMRGQGTLWLTGAVDRAIGSLTIGRGTVRLADGASLGVSGDAKVEFITSSSSDFNGIPRLTVGNGCSYVANGTTILAQTGTTRGHGILEIHDAAVVTNKMQVGVRGGGYVRQLGGSLCWVGDGNGVLGQVAGSYGVYMITNGTMRCSQNSCFAFASSGTGLYYQRGGNSYPDYTLNMGASGGAAEIYISAGEFVNTKSVSVGGSGGGRAIITLDGPTAAFNASFLAQNATAGSSLAQVNVRNGGVMRPPYICRTTDSESNPSIQLVLTSDGGTFRRSNTDPNAKDWHKYLGQATTAWRPADKLVVYKGGVTFESIGTNRWSTPILAPRGKGIKSITLPQEVLALRNYPGPAILTLTATAGEGATAICDFDPIVSTGMSDLGRQKGVIVTCPGWGYADEGGTPSVTCTVRHPNYLSSTTYNATVELADNDTSGGLVKTGDGQLIIASHGNTYGGETCVSNGTLIVEQGADLPAWSPIRICNAALSFNDDNAVISNLTVEGSALISGVGIQIANSFTCDAAQAAQDRYATIPSGVAFANGAKVVIRNTDALTMGKPILTVGDSAEISGVENITVEDETGAALENVRVRLSSDRKTLSASPVRGFVLTFR